MSLLNQFTTIGGKYPTLYENVVDLSKEDIQIADDDELCDIICTEYNSRFLKSGIYKIKYKNENDNVVDKDIIYSEIDSNEDEDNINIYLIGNDNILYKFSSKYYVLDPVSTDSSAQDLINLWSNGLQISHLERKNNAITYEINSQEDFDNTFLNDNWRPGDSIVKFNCSVDARNQEIVIPGNVQSIYGNNNSIINLISLGYANFRDDDDFYDYSCIKDLTLSIHFKKDDNNNYYGKGLYNCKNIYHCRIFGDGKNTDEYDKVFAYGFANCENLYNCLVYNVGTGYQSCKNLYNCVSGKPSDTMLVIDGFAGCENLYGCKYISSDISGLHENANFYNFHVCNNLINCESVIYNNYYLHNNYSNCINLYNCTVKYKYDGTNASPHDLFIDCKNLNSCYYKNDFIGDYESEIINNNNYNIFTNCGIVKDCIGGKTNCTNVFNTSEIIKNQITYKGPINVVERISDEYWDNSKVDFGDCYLLYGRNGINRLEILNNFELNYFVKNTEDIEIGSIITIDETSFNNEDHSFNFSILDNMYIPILHNCIMMVILRDNTQPICYCSIYKDNNGYLRIRIQTNIYDENSYIDTVPDNFYIETNFAFKMKMTVSSNDKIIWREPGFWDIIPTRN